eukprot:SAG11_NODE_2316_length_3532_cov_45.795514_4_plen_86_part_00
MNEIDAVCWGSGAMDPLKEALVLVVEHLDAQHTRGSAEDADWDLVWGVVCEAQHKAIAIPEYYPRIRGLGCLVEFRKCFNRGEFS